MSNTDFKHWFLGYDSSIADEFRNPDRVLFTESPNEVEVLVDGASYMQKLYDVIDSDNATSGDVIYFAGLELKWDLYLIPDNGFSQILEVLDRAHKNGADVRVLLSFHYHNRFELTTNVDTFRRLWSRGIECIYDISAGVKKWFTGAAHQKFAIICRAGKLHGFCGGIDITYDRWDTDQHDSKKQNNGINRPFAQSFPAGWHDVHTYIQGAACHDLLTSFEERWNFIVDTPEIRSRFNVKSRKPSTLGSPQISPIPLNGGHHVQVLRTYPCFRPEEGEIELPFAKHGEMSAREACLKAIRQAEYLIYIEDQYFYSYEIASALIDALNSKPRLRVLVVVPREPNADPLYEWANYHQGQVIDMIHTSVGYERFGIYDLNIDPVTDLVENQIYVHAKLMIIDDVWVEIGSMNCNRRSTTHDFEMCVAVVDDATSTYTSTEMGTVCDFAHDLRLRLWEEHLGVPPSQISHDHVIGFDFWRTHSDISPHHARNHIASLNNERKWIFWKPNLWNSQIDIEGSCPDEDRIPPL